MSVSDIEDELKDIYKINLSTSAISVITNKVTQAAIEWQNRPLESGIKYCTVDSGLVDRSITFDF